MVRPLPIVASAPASSDRGAASEKRSGAPRQGLPAVKGRYSFVSLGCAKNLVDSERMLGLLQLDGYELTPDSKGTDFVVVNTCGFIDQARSESFAAIHEAIELKRAGHTRGVIVAGCLAERQKESLLEQCPEVDHLVGVFGRDEIGRVADRLLGRQTEQRTLFHPAPIRALADTHRLRITPKHFAYLKISEGCDRLCTFCAIPKMRGKHASKPIESILDEARELAADGVRELIVVAQDTTYYGLDLYGEPRLAQLLGELEQVAGIDWIRLMYFYPMYISDELIARIAGSPKILPYLDMPLQHANDFMLRRMARKVTRSETEALLGRLRSSIPNLAIRTTLITGFPGETEEHVQDLIDFVQAQQFQRAGVFTYSFEPDTPAALLPGHVAEEEKAARRERIMEAQQAVAFAWCDRQIGRTLDVILDQPVPNEKNAWVGRSAADAPDVDAVVYVTGKRLTAGKIVSCEVVARHDYDLVAVAVGTPR